MSKSTNVTVSVAMDEEQLNTLQVYLLQGDKALESILKETVSDTLAKLYAKHVPQAVQNFLALKSDVSVPNDEKSKLKRKPHERKDKFPDGQELVMGESEDIKPAMN